MQLINGNVIAQKVTEELKSEIDQLTGSFPTVTFVRVGQDPASVSYVNKKVSVAREIGIQSQLIELPESITKDELCTQIDALNADSNVHGILVQAPLPAHISETEIFNRVAPDKDVDGFNSINIGKLCQEDDTGFVSCTPAGIIELLKRSEVETAGRHVVVVGRSLIVGKPSALLLLKKSIDGNATVTVCHSRTKDLGAITRQADILIAAIGQPHCITTDKVKPGAAIIDVGINRIPDPSRKSGYRLVGDVDFDKVAPLCDKITPVPGGVGPMTVAMLMRNTLKAFYKNR